MERQPSVRKHLLGYGLLKETKNDLRFAMNALPEYFSVAAPKEFTPPETPPALRDRHAKIQQLLNDLEPALRDLIMFQMRALHGAGWQIKVSEHLKGDTLKKVESKGSLSGKQFMEETYFPELLQLIPANWRVFANVFGDKAKFKDAARHAEIARSLADHRKMQMCGEDSKYIPALDACEWLAAKLLS